MKKDKKKEKVEKTNNAVRKGGKVLSEPITLGELVQSPACYALFV